MNTTDGTLSFAAILDTTQYDKGIAQINAQTQSVGTNVSSMLNNIATPAEGAAESLKKIGLAIGGYFSFQALKELSSQIFNVRSEIQSLEISFQTLLGSKDKADAMFSSIRKFAVETPMQLKDLASAAQLMLSFNIEEDKIMPYLKALGDVSMGDTARFNSLALSFAQMSSAGKLMGQDLMQMINAGFNPLAVMAEKTGKSISELKDEMSKGAITSQMVQQAFIDATSAGGKYFGMLEKQSKGLQGAFSNLQGAMDDMYNEIGTSTEGVMAGALDITTALVKNYKVLMDVILGVAAAYGTYKAALMIDTAKTNILGAAAYQAEAAELQKVIALKQANVDADLQQAVSTGKMTEAKASQIMAMRTEAAETAKALAIKAQEAKVTLEQAAMAELSAKQRYLAAVQNAKATATQATQVAISGDMFAAEAAAATADAAAQERDAAAKAYDAAMTNRKNAAQAASIATTQAETAQTALSTAATKGATASTTLLSATKAKLIGVVTKLNAAIMANPYVAAAAAIAALAYGVYKLITYETDAEKAQKKLNETIKSGVEATAKEQATIDGLFSSLRTLEKGTKAYNTVKDAIISKYGEYLQGLINEKNEIIDLEKAYKRVAVAARAAANARNIETLTTQASDEYAKQYADYIEKIRKKLEEKSKNGQADVLLQLIKDDIESVGKVSTATNRLINQAFGTKKKDNNKGWEINKDVVEIRKWVKEIVNQKNIQEDAIKRIEENFGSAENSYIDLGASASALKGEITALNDAIKGGSI